MDVDEEWEVLPEDGFLEIHDDGAGKNIFSRKYNTDGDFNMNYTYFVCPPPPPKPYSSQFVDPTKPPTTGLKSVGAASEPAETDKMISQVRFKKMNDHHHQAAEFSAADMKMDSPRSANTAVVVPAQTDDDVRGGGEAFEGTKDVVSSSSSPGRAEEEEGIEENEEEGRGFNLWQWSLSGIGAICSFGMAAATTICIVFIENHQKHKRLQHQNNHNFRFQIYTHHDNKRIKEVVQHASKLDEAISTVRGVPYTRASITFGGYCDAF